MKEITILLIVTLLLMTYMIENNARFKEFEQNQKVIKENQELVVEFLQGFKKAQANRIKKGDELK